MSTLAQRVVVPVLRRVWLVLALSLLWEVAARRAGSLFVPPPSAILRRTFELWVAVPPGGWREHLLWRQMTPSLLRMLAGWLLAVLVGVCVGIALGRVQTAAAFFQPLIRFGMSIPPPALLPFSIVLLGIGDTAKVFLVFFGCIWPVLLNSIDGSRSIDPTLLRTGRTMQLSRRSTIRYLFLPAAAPQMFAGIRVSLSVAVILMVVSEMYAASSGVGFTIVNAQRAFRTLDMWAGIVVLGVLGITLNKLLLRIERRILAWHHGMRATSAAS